MTDQSQIHEIQIENLTPDFFDAQALRLPAYRLKRFQLRGLRYYYLYDAATEKVSIYPSSTTIVSKTMQKGQELIEWYAKMGVAKAKEYTNSRADFGSYFHMLISRYLRGEEIILTDINRAPLLEDFRSYAIMCNRGFEWANSNYEELVFQFVAFTQFCEEYRIKPIFIEGQLKSDKINAAATLDIVAYISVREKGFFGETYKRAGKRKDATTGEEIAYVKGDPKESYGYVQYLVYIDAKTGKSVYDSHIVQCEINRRIWNDNFPDLPIVDTYVWRPKDFRKSKTPGFNLSPSNKREGVIDVISDYLSIMKKRARRDLARPAQTVYQGKFLLGQENVPQIETLTLEQSILRAERALNQDVETSIFDASTSLKEL